jgi:hypothetical protein
VCSACVPLTDSPSGAEDFFFGKWLQMVGFYLGVPLLRWFFGAFFPAARLIFSFFYILL